MELNQTEQTLIALLRRAWCGESSLPEGAVDWGKVYQLSLRQGVAAVAFDGLRQIAIPTALRYEWMAQTLRCELDYEAKRKAIGQLSQLWSSHGLQGIILKGMAFAQFYPKPSHRPCGDLDVFFFDDWELANRAVEETGTVVSRGFYKNSSFTWQGMLVENHQFCTPVRGSRRRKQYERFLQQLMREGPLQPIEGVALLSPPPLFNLLFFLSHARGHFLFEGGVTLRFVCDWAALLRAYGPQGPYQQSSAFWDDFLQYCDDYDLLPFACAMSRLAQRVFDVPVPFDCGTDSKADDVLWTDMMKAGERPVEFFRGWRTRWQLLRRQLASRRKFRCFSRQSMLASLLGQGWAFVFDRHPSL